MRTKEELIREVEDRNKLRAEVEKIHKGELWQDFRDWCGTYPCGLRLPRKSYRRCAMRLATPRGFRVGY
jgi:hypothetical protein